MRYKLVARRLNIRKRFLALTTAEKHRAKFWRKLAIIFLIKWRTDNDKTMHLRARICFLRYHQLVIEPPITLERPLRLNITIDSFSESVCWNYFETRKEDLSRLLYGLRFPEDCVLENGSRMSGEEVLLRGLFELVSGDDQFTIAEAIFGREQSQQSRAFKYFVDHIFNNFLFLVRDNLSWWFDNGYFHESNRAIKAKLEALGLQFNNDDECDVCTFLDCNCMETGRVGGGPRSDGPDADRWLDEVQRTFYNGWKSIHGLKHQTVDLAHGFTIDMFGPTSLRRSDLRLLSESNINARLAELMADLEQQLRAYGDSIYPHLSHVYSSHRQQQLTDRQQQENRALKTVRVSIEWNYGAAAKLFGYLTKLEKLKVLDGTVCVRIYTVCIILKNCHIALYGGQSSNYFDIRIPDDMLEKYLRVN